MTLIDKLILFLSRLGIFFPSQDSFGPDQPGSWYYHNTGCVGAQLQSVSFMRGPK